MTQIQILLSILSSKTKSGLLAVVAFLQQEQPVICCVWLYIHCLLIWCIQLPGALHLPSSISHLASFHDLVSNHLLQYDHDCCCFPGVEILGQPYMTFLLQLSIQFTLLLFSSVLIYPLLFHPFLASPSFPSMLVSIFLQSALHLSECFLLQIESLLQHLPLPLLLPILLNSPHWCSLFFMQL